MKYFLILLSLFLLLSCSDDKSEILLLSRPIVETDRISGNYLLEFQIYPKEEPRKIYVLYKLNHTEDMIKLKANKLRDTIYQVNIPAQSYGNTIFYHIDGIDYQGSRIRYPKNGELHFSIVRKDLSCTLDSDCLEYEFCKKGSCSLFLNRCENNDDCPTDYICNLQNNQKCEIPLKNCLVKTDCDNNYYCTNNSCLTLGKECQTSVECLLGETCKENHCQMSNNCQNDSQCEEGLHCNSEYNLCLLDAQCETNQDCKSPLICNQTIKQCVVNTCEVHIDCLGENERCDITTKTCVISTDVECHNDTECTDSFCDLNDLKCKECISSINCTNGKVCIDNSCI